MIHERRIHLGLSARDREAMRAVDRMRVILTPEQSAIMALLDRIEALERDMALLQIDIEEH